MRVLGITLGYFRPPPIELASAMPSRRSPKPSMIEPMPSQRVIDANGITWRMPMVSLTARFAVSRRGKADLETESQGVVERFFERRHLRNERRAPMVWAPEG
jgi:hypothetical protein